VSAYKITEKTLRAIVRKRADMAAEYGTALAKPNGLQDAFELYAPFSAGRTYRNRATGIKQGLTCRGWANVRLVNGTTIECALPVKRMAEWAKGSKVLDMEITHLPDSVLPVKITMRRDAGSSVILYGKTVDAPILRGYRNAAPVQWLGEHIQLNAPVNGGEFVA